MKAWVSVLRGEVGLLWSPLIIGGGLSFSWISLVLLSRTPWWNDPWRCLLHIQLRCSDSLLVAILGSWCPWAWVIFGRRERLHYTILCRQAWLPWQLGAHVSILKTWMDSLSVLAFMGRTRIRLLLYLYNTNKYLLPLFEVTGNYTVSSIAICFLWYMILVKNMSESYSRGDRGPLGGCQALTRFLGLDGFFIWYSPHKVSIAVVGVVVQKYSVWP